MKSKQLLPTKKEGRKLIFEAWRYLLLALLAAVGVALAAARGWLGGHAHDTWSLGAQEYAVRGWVLLALSACALLGVIQLIRWLVLPFRSSHVRLFRSLSREEQLIIRLLAQSEFGISEGELSELVPVPTQRFLYFIDHLVRQLRLAERTEPASGGAFWALTEHGRLVAAANHLFHQRPNQSLQPTAGRSDE